MVFCHRFRLKGLLLADYDRECVDTSLIWTGKQRSFYSSVKMSGSLHPCSGWDQKGIKYRYQMLFVFCHRFRGRGLRSLTVRKRVDRVQISQLLKKKKKVLKKRRRVNHQVFAVVKKSSIRKRGVLSSLQIDTARESALKLDSGRKIPCRTGESNLRQRRAGPTLYQMSYIPTPKSFQIVQRKCQSCAAMFFVFFVCVFCCCCFFFWGGGG